MKKIVEDYTNMSLPGKCVTIRMPQAMAESLDELRTELPGLPMSILIRMVLKSVLDRPLAGRVKIIEQQLRVPGVNNSSTAT